jgi:protein-arginine kinase activator protein McsA
MVKCERCGMGFGPIQAAVLEFCPRCKARDHVDVRLIVGRVREESAPENGEAGESGPEARSRISR